ncbi:peptidase inhibitor family I36 protein [Streptomyces sp. S063]|uniref:peptidase inhibitor family I36 protein n=1 Tax=Streptomyces sp. S063 TaxID=2005885 RepID=UPI00100810BB|nr:peptidase inhibitor family I36 protein [Streptomyces sp. S063]
MRKKLTFGLFAAAMIVGGVGTATAAPAGCESGWVCLYRDDDYRGGQVSLTNSTTAISHLSSRGFNDNADSYYSNYTYDSAWWTDANYVGRRVCMHNNTSNRSFSFQDSDEASSTKKYTSRTAC